MTRAANDNNQPLSADSFARLPLFATDKEIAVAIVGKTRAAEWLRNSFPAIASRPSFPKVDAAHGGRAVPRIKLFYDEYLSLTGEHPGFAVDGEEDFAPWKKSKRRA